MKFQSNSKTIVGRLLGMTLFAAMAMPAGVIAQGTATPNPPPPFHHYKLFDMGTLGGPNSFSCWSGCLSINAGGTVIAEADTPFGDPFAPFCLQGCLVDHGLLWKNGVATDMGALPGGGNSSFPVWISDRGDSAGISNNGLYDPLTGYPEFRATLWTGGKIFDLGTLGGNYSFANAINNGGQVAGGALNTIPDADVNGLNWSPFPLATQMRAFLWQKGKMRDLGTLGSGKDAAAIFVNDQGQVSGISYTNTIANATTGIPTLDPFFWENGKMVDIGTLGGTSGGPWYMNGLGQVVGISNLAGDQVGHAFVWDKRNGLKDLGILPGATSYSVATWINESGEIVGADDFFSGGSSILWKNEKMIDLGKLPGDCSSEAVAINASGQIIGNSSPDCNSDGVGVLWNDGGAPISLNTLVTPASDIDVTFPVYINDQGEIVAHAALPNGDIHAIVLVPCDDNHPNLEGCNYGTVAAVSAAPASSAKNTEPFAIATPGKQSSFETAKRLRALKAGNAGHFGASQTSPK
jgi:probable HAF family extracellular repeat protein